MDTQTKVFVDGLFIKDIPDSTPDYILASYSINVEKFKAWLDQNQESAVKGWLNITIKRSKNGSKYAELDTWKMPESSQTPENAPVTHENALGAPNNTMSAEEQVALEKLAEDTPF